VHRLAAGRAARLDPPSVVRLEALGFLWAPPLVLPWACPRVNGWENAYHVSISRFLQTLTSSRFAQTLTSSLRFVQTLTFSSSFPHTVLISYDFLSGDNDDGSVCYWGENDHNSRQQHPLLSLGNVRSLLPNPSLTKMAVVPPRL